MNIKYQIISLFSGILLMSLYSCQSAEGNQTGSEYMPDMAHSVAYEANTYGYYYNNRWGSMEDLHAMVQPRNPVNGTIARGYAGSIESHNLGMESHNGISIRGNGSVPYYYSDTEEERTRAMAEIIKNPYPISDKGLELGKVLYNIQCGICHGEKGDGGGYLVRDDGGKYPVQPANFLLEEFVNASNGRYYHAIMYGKNLMGGYSDKLSYEERWNVIQYIRSLQATSLKLEYSSKANTFNTTDITYASVAAMKAAEMVATPVAVQDTVANKVEHGSHH